MASDEEIRKEWLKNFAKQKEQEAARERGRQRRVKAQQAKKDKK